MGGGVALTLSHDLDLVNWLADSKIKTVAKKFGYSSNLNIDVESVADFQISYQNDITAQVFELPGANTPTQIHFYF